MISCRDFTGLLIDFVEDELTIEQSLTLEEHLHACPPCRTFLSTYQLTIRCSQKLCARPLPAELVQKLRTALAPHLGARDCAPPPP